MKNIAIIIPDITRPAGTERAVCNLANILADYEKYLPTVISVNSSAGKPYYPINEKVEIIHCCVVEKNKFLKRIKEFKQLKKVCAAKNFEVAIGVYPAINVFLPFIRRLKIKIAAEHLNYASAPLFPKIIRRLFYPFLDAVVLLTNNDAKHYGFHNNAVAIPNSLSFIPKKQSVLEKKVILAVGRLSYQKGFERLIEAVSLIKEKCGGWQVRIIGSGEDKEKLLRQIKETELENIITIMPPTDKIEEEYYNSSVYVMSSRWEGLPMVLIEAKSYGLPIVSFDCPEGPTDIIRDGIDGLLVKKDNVKLLSQAILKLIEDENLRKSFGHEAVKDIDKFKPEHVGALWDKLFNGLIDKRNSDVRKRK
ncbi:MAG: glycosyltransferase family 4 protein [Chitinivibrionia bacterium]|nr:glycosyltransferase family 4 protein [Chitinivibrionia bacterium]